MVDDILIVGAGIGGLTLALMLERAGIPCRVVEAAPEIRPVGVGINVLPHAAAELCALGLENALAAVAVTTRESAFFNRFGQLIYSEPAGRAAGHPAPQFSIHRGELQRVLADTVITRIGQGRLHTGWRCVGAGTENGRAVVDLVDSDDRPLRSLTGRAVVACDGIHSIIRRGLHPDEGPPKYSGVNMWRGTTRWPPFLSGATMVRAGWLATGKMVIYPIRDAVDAEGRQLVNWVAEIETPDYKRRDWNRPGRLEDFLPAFADWRFDWLDVPAFLRASDLVLEFPMVDQDPLPFWRGGLVTLLGDAAHPMYPRGSNGAGQAILDARALTDALRAHADIGAALDAYEGKRRPATAAVVHANRTNPPDAVLREVFLRTGDRPFTDIDSVIPRSELVALVDGYRQVTAARP